LLKRILAALIVAAALPLLSTAQDETGKDFSIRSLPPGAEVILKGDALVTGVTPTTFRYPLMGRYDLTVKKHGYEDYRTKLLLDPAQGMQLDVELSRKTGFKAGLRSMLIPGWGQHYMGQNTKAFTFGFLILGSVTAFLIADHNFDIKQLRYEQRLEEYNEAIASGAVSNEILQRRLDAKNLAMEKAYDMETVRQTTGGILVGIWALNVLDALFFSPTEKATFTVEGLTLTPSTDTEGVGLRLSKAF